MKLKFSDNFRKLRHEKNLTQEQLAERLCVSFQSVSRWETGVTYPDITLLPVIADFFGTTVDALLGAEKTENGRAPEECYDQLNALIDSGADVLCFLRKIHRDFPKDQHILSLLCRELRYYNTEHDNELLKEQRRLTDELLSQNAEKGYQEMVVMDMVQVEPDDTLLEELLNRYSTEEDMRRMKLLEAHSYSLKQWDKYEPIKQLIAWRGLTEDLFDRMVCEYPSTVNVYHSLWASEKRLSIINLLTECQSHSVAAGDGVPDLWGGFRINVGIRYVCHLASAGFPEKALDELEHLTDFVETLFGLSEGTELTYRCRAFDKLSGTVSFAILPHRCDNGRDHKALTMRNDDYGIWECVFLYNLIFWLTTREGWEWFDPIRDHPRYIACVERFKKLDVLEQERGTCG